MQGYPLPCARPVLVCQRVDCNIERQLLAILRTDAFAFIASVVGAEGAAETIFAHYGHETALIEQTFQLNVPGLVEATNALNIVKRAVDEMVIRDRLNLFIRENAAELAPPCLGKVRVRTTP